MSRLWGVMLIAGALLAGCNGKPASPGSAPPGSSQSVKPPIAQSASDEFHYNDPCSLLQPKEVETVLGAPLGTPPYRAQGPSPRANGPDCVYESSDFHRILLTVVFSDGAQNYRLAGFGKKMLSTAPNETAKKAFQMDDGTELTGEWDEAQLLALNCCIFLALRGDQMITIDFTGSNANLRAAATLVDSAFKRIDKPLKLDGGANISAGKAWEQKRPKPQEACTILTRAEVEAVLGPLLAAPVGHGTISCSYEAQPERGIPQVYELVYDWRGGYAQARSDAFVTKTGISALGGKPAATDDKEMNAEVSDRFGPTGREFVALKNDVRIKGVKAFLDPDKVRSLVAAARGKI